MIAQRTVNRFALLAAAQLAVVLSLAACSNSAMQPPAGTNRGAYANSAGARGRCLQPDQYSRRARHQL